ncbi:NADP-dependent oxidoreductase [Chromobacterium sphagni]|uniref:NADP-dependent oxidoreductase n=1 Tax=Chromobacterium sphagni TaxID=1903179 RepID=A0A1S1WWB6_9NEIS|nr:NADP-dependent oxidoreductase [Chromobacterium sphagni]OHX11600.1 NADP-dependent oxidoreductase [Chromobacterium sphagni]
MTTLPQTSREVRLAARPKSMPRPEHFTIAEAAVRQPGPHEIVVRNRWFRVSVSTRTMIREGAENIKGIPFPALNIGDTLADGAIGEVVWAPPESGFQLGDLVSHALGWREYATVTISGCAPLPDERIDPAAYLGHGATAYAALTGGVQVQPGDTVFISSRAGAIGSMAGQIARRLRAGHVVGSTGSRDKAAWMQAEQGYDAAVVRDSGPIAQQLAQAAPEGIDVFVDMVGGEQLRAAAAIAREGARFVLLGALTAEFDADEAGMRAPVMLDSFALIIKGVTVRGYSACVEDPGFIKEWLARLAEWQRGSGMHLACSKFSGLENAPRALHEACVGRLTGVVLVELGPHNR